MLRTFKNDKEFYASLPKKRVMVNALLFYKSDLLIVKTNYNPGWTLPGGAVEGEESPAEALQRVIKEELSLKVEPAELLSVDYISNRDFKGEGIHFLFSTKDLNETQARGIHLAPQELLDHKFVSIERALDLLTPETAKRVFNSLDAKEKNRGAIYLENGIHEPLSSLIADR